MPVDFPGNFIIDVQHGILIFHIVPEWFKVPGIMMPDFYRISALNMPRTDSFFAKSEAIMRAVIQFAGYGFQLLKMAFDDSTYSPGRSGIVARIVSFSGVSSSKT